MRHCPAWLPGGPSLPPFSLDQGAHRLDASMLLALSELWKSVGLVGLWLRLVGVR